MGYKDWPIDNRSGNWEGHPYTTTKNPKLCLHTTETPGWPNYEWPPHITYDIDNDRGRRHVRLDRGAYALKSGRSTGGHSSNYEAGPVFQIEIISYAKDSLGKPDWWYDRLNRLIVEVCDDFGVPKVIHPYMFDRTGAYGTNGVNRLSWDEFKSFSGVLGHQHAPAPNAHWDPGDLDETRLKLTGSTPVPPVPPKPLEAHVTPEQMAALLAAIGRVPRQVWADTPSGPAGPSAYQTLLRTKANTDVLIRDLSELDVDELVATIRQLPDENVNALWRRLAPGPA